MVRWCTICDKEDTQCVMPGVHRRDDAKGRAERQEILFGMFEEERRVDLEMGREAREFKWKEQAALESVEWRETLREHGRAVAVSQAGAREAKIGRQVCDICMVARSACDWPEVHFSRQAFNVKHCNEVSGVWCLMLEMLEMC